MPRLTDFTLPPNDLPGLPPGAVWHTVIVRDAAALDEVALSDAAEQAYLQLKALLDRGPRLHVARLWNFIPKITAPTAGGRDRYMAFNAGRYRALTSWYGSGGLAGHAPAATGVGALGDDLIVHLLATPHATMPLQNPQQTPAMEYSARFGPRPPCFARATRVAGTLLVSGTAAIRGEESVAPGDLSAQLDLTLDHLGTLAGGLSAYTALRVYTRTRLDSVEVLRRLKDAFAREVHIDYAVTDLCRRELLVEIEGVARDSGPA